MSYAGFVANDVMTYLVGVMFMDSVLFTAYSYVNGAP